MKKISFTLPILIVISLTFLASCTLPGKETDSYRSQTGSTSGTSRDFDGRERGDRQGRPPRDPRPELSQSGSAADVSPTQSVAPEPQSEVVPSSPQTSVVTPVNTVASTTVSGTTQATSAIPTSITKTVTYTTDHGRHDVTVDFAISTDATGKITSVSTTMTSGDHESARYISRFDSAARSQIVGKKISDLSLSTIGGASDTTDAFRQTVASL